MRTHASLGRTVRLLATVASLGTASDLYAGGPPPASEVTVEVSASSGQAGQVLYSIRVRNRSTDRLGGFRLQAQLPKGAVLIGTVASPGGARPEARTDGSVAWTLDTFHPETILAPFAYRVAVGNAPVESRATARWETPSPGEASAELSGYEDATAPVAHITFGPEGSQGLTAVPGSGLSYYALAGKAPVSLRLSRSDREPTGPTTPRLRWVSRLEVHADGAQGSPKVPMALVVPLDHALPPFTPVFLYANDGTGWELGKVQGTVTQDGLHAVVAPDHFSDLAVGVEATILEGLEDVTLNDTTGRLHQAAMETLEQLLLESTAAVLNFVENPPQFEPTRTDSHKRHCTSFGYCLDVTCDGEECVACFGWEDEPIRNWDCQSFPLPNTGGGGVCGDAVCFVPDIGSATSLSDALELPTFFETLAPMDLTNVLFRTPTAPPAGGTWQEVQGPSDDGTRLLFGVGVLDGQVVRILGSAGAGRVEPIGAGLRVPEIGLVQTVFAMAAAPLPSNLVEHFATDLRGALAALVAGRADRARTLIQGVRHGFEVRAASLVSAAVRQHLLARLDQLLAALPRRSDETLMHVVDPDGRGTIACHLHQDDLRERRFLLCQAKDMQILLAGRQLDEWVVPIDPRTSAPCCRASLPCCKPRDPDCPCALFDLMAEKNSYPEQCQGQGREWTCGPGALASLGRVETGVAWSSDGEAGPAPARCSVDAHP